MLGLKFSRQASKFLERCDNYLYKRLMEKIKELLINPYPSESLRVRGKKNNAQRIRVGRFRIIYVVIKENNELFIVDIDKRERVYN